MKAREIRYLDGIEQVFQLHAKVITVTVLGPKIITSMDNQYEYLDGIEQVLD